MMTDQHHLRRDPNSMLAWCGANRYDHDVAVSPTDATCLDCLRAAATARGPASAQRDQHDAPQCPHRHGPMQEMEWGQGPYYIAWRCVDPTCGAIGEAFLLAQEYERGRQDERQRSEALVRELERAIDQELEARDKAQDALLEASGAMGGPEWSSRIPEPDPPDSGDLHRDVPELARQIVAERDRLREALRPFAEYADRCEDVNWLPDTASVGYTPERLGPLTIGHLRAARSVLADTCPDCGTPLKAHLPEHDGATGYHYCPNEACPTKAPHGKTGWPKTCSKCGSKMQGPQDTLAHQDGSACKESASHGRCWCGAPLVWSEDIDLGRKPESKIVLRCSVNLDHRPCPGCEQWVEWRENPDGNLAGGRYQHLHNQRVPAASSCPGPNKESDDA